MKTKKDIIQAIVLNYKKSDEKDNQHFFEWDWGAHEDFASYFVDGQGVSSEIFNDAWQEAAKQVGKKAEKNPYLKVKK